MDILKQNYLTKLDQLLESVGDMALKTRARWMISKLNLQQGDSVLDVGCGDGYFLHLISSLGITLHMSGCDLDDNALKSAQRNLSGRNIKILKADLMQKISLPSNSINKITMSEVTEHLPDDVKGMKEVYRVLAKNGTLCISVPNHNYPFLWDPINWVLERLFKIHIQNGFWAGIWNQHLRLYNKDQIIFVLQKAGFIIKDVNCSIHYCLPFNHYLLNLAAIFLYGGSLSPTVSDEISKFKKTPKRRLVIELLFRYVNFINSKNYNYHGSISTNVVICATKK